MAVIKLLDLCCKAGGAAKGYEQAALDLGFKIEITGIDIEPQKNYPFKFIQADAVEYLKNNWQQFTHIHASPPCQQYTPSTKQFRLKGETYHDILAPVRKLMHDIPLPGVIENVLAAPMLADIILRGDMFGLKVIRKRKFETIHWFIMEPLQPKLEGSVKGGDYVSVFGNGSNIQVKNGVVAKFKRATIRETWAYAMGIDWYMTNNELGEAIPPAYTNYIGYEFFKQTIK